MKCARKVSNGKSFYVFFYLSLLSHIVFLQAPQIFLSDGFIFIHARITSKGGSCFGTDSDFFWKRVKDWISLCYVTGSIRLKEEFSTILKTLVNRKKVQFIQKKKLKLKALKLDFLNLLNSSKFWWVSIKTI